jgi:hypothetical protein
MTWKDEVNSLHRLAMEHADASLYYAYRSDVSRRDAENKRALELEEQAVELLAQNGSCEPTLTILRRSAATLALSCGDLDRAERHAAMALLGKGPDALKQDARDVIRRIRIERCGYRIRPVTRKRDRASVAGRRMR